MSETVKWSLNPSGDIEQDFGEDNPELKTAFESIDEGIETIRTRGGKLVEGMAQEERQKYKEDLLARIQVEDEKIKQLDELMATRAEGTHTAPNVAPNAAPNAAPDSAPKAAGAETQNSSEVARKTAEKAKRNQALKEFLKKKSTKVIAIVLAAVITVSAAAVGISSLIHKNKANVAPSAPEKQTEESVGDNHGYDETILDDFDNTGGENKESKESISDISTYKGLFASEDGSTYNPLKHGKYNIGIELESGATEEEMKEDFSGRQIQPGQLAMTYHYMQQKTTDPNFGVDGAKFDNPDQLLEAMESDSDLHQRVYDYVISLINNNNMKENVFTGTAHNYYADSKFETGDIDTSNVEIVGCTTHENGTKIYELSVNWTDEQGNIHTDVYKFKERCGGQPLELINFTTSVRQIPEDEIEDDDPGDKPDDDNPGDDDPGDDDPGDDDPGDELDKKNEQALEDNAGPRVDQRNLDNNVTPQTPLKDDQKNFEAIEKQKEEDAKKAEEAQRIKEEQAAKEEQAKKEAEARRQAEEEAARKASEEEKAREAEAAAKAEAAKKAAEEEAAKKQAEAAEAERKAAEEEAARKAAEEEANKNNVENNAEADSNNDAGADERGDMFNNGDY